MCIRDRRNAEDLVQGTEQAGGTGFPLEEPYQACIRPARQLQRQLDAQWEQAFAAAKEAAAKGEDVYKRQFPG